MKWEKPHRTLSTELQLILLVVLISTVSIILREESGVHIPRGGTWVSGAGKRQPVCLGCPSCPAWSAHLSYSQLKLAILLTDFRRAHRRKDRPPCPSWQALFWLAALPHDIGWPRSAVPPLTVGHLASGQSLQDPAMGGSCICSPQKQIPLIGASPLERAKQGSPKASVSINIKGVRMQEEPQNCQRLNFYSWAGPARPAYLWSRRPSMPWFLVVPWFLVDPVHPSYVYYHSPLHESDSAALQFLHCTGIESRQCYIYYQDSASHIVNTRWVFAESWKNAWMSIRSAWHIINVP